MSNDPRQVLEQLCAERREDFRTLSRMLGRNTSYIQQFVRRGVPKRLGEEERRKLARYFGVPEKIFGGPAQDNSGPSGLVGVPRHSTFNAEPEEFGGIKEPYIAFDEKWLKGLVPTDAPDFAVLQMTGDAMAPTLNAGDDMLVDRADSGERLRDGIYAIQPNGPLVVRRIAINPITQRITVKSDNPAYPDWPDCRSEDVGTVGRVVWFGRRMPE